MNIRNVLGILYFLFEDVDMICSKLFIFSCTADLISCLCSNFFFFFKLNLIFGVYLSGYML